VKPAPAASKPQAAAAAAPAATPRTPPTPPAADEGEQTRNFAAPLVPGASADPAREARALSIAVEAIADFLGRTSSSARAAEAITALERDLALAAEGRLDAQGNPVRAVSAKAIVDELNRLMARLRTASSDLL
jgi:hypothetical protein